MKLALALGVAALSCAPGPAPCTTAGTCPEGTECIANRCSVTGYDPASPTSRRWTREPSALVFTTGARSQARAGPALVFGNGALGAARVLLAFDLPWSEVRRVESAFVVLSPLPGVVTGGADVRVRALSVREPWSPADVARGAAPRLAAPESSGIAQTSPPQALRIDVTAWAEWARAHPSLEHGLALLASGGSDSGAAFASGESGDPAPRLEIYGQ